MKFNLTLKKLVANFSSDKIENPVEDEIIVIEKNSLSEVESEAETIFEKRKKENLEILKTISKVIKARKYNKILTGIDFFILEEVVFVNN